ncbi:Fructose-bisphosphate aldolase [Seminavis robusta]|uniref:fructose-bisphosphate aldolase n=1 Tax=Seminavis robusta TaxID=568900 RepID=A0A9N8HCW6_9STRA|nr:Fructose-bisphosphate aldolase [Seminavis robusta]|eukprot:Sro236_g094900.1 Fructose-bisphosphate aldolase (388) ;mRNA; r:13077-14240
MKFVQASLFLLTVTGSASAFSVGGTFLSAAEKAALEETANAVATPGKGITACDEGPATIGGRFDNVGVENSEETRRQYRQMLFEAPGCNDYLSAAILDPETLYQKSSTNDKLFPEVLTERGIVPGIKPHLKIYTLPGTNGDTVMQGLDSLSVRCKEYYDGGARFAKWRSPLVIDVAKGCPTDLAIKANMQDLARYALICQSEGLMPIVEPDVSLSGTHTLEQAADINIRIQSELFKAMIDHGVYMPGTTLKPNIINPGKDCETTYTVEEIAEANVYVLEQSFPVAMPGANYLSGGQTLEQAASRLSAINKANTKGPWNLSFSWSQALQLPLLELCKGKGELQLDEMSKLYVEELAIASAAAKGEYEWQEGQGDHPSVAVPVKELTSA